MQSIETIINECLNKQNLKKIVKQMRREEVIEVLKGLNYQLKEDVK